MTTPVRLKKFGSKETVLFDPASGQVRPDSSRGQEQVVGYLTDLDGRSVALFTQAGRLYLSDGRGQLELRRVSGLPFSWQRVDGGRRNRVAFDLRGGSHELVYASAASRHIGDPSFDAMDEEMEDMFLFLTRVTKTRGELETELTR